MKKLFLFGVILCSLTGNSQDTLKIEQIDSIIDAINKSQLAVQTDSIIQDLPQYGIFTKTYISAYFAGTDLVKYVNKTDGVNKSEGKTESSNTSTTFYFEKHKLIKVEDTANMNGKVVKADWYYSEDKPLYYTLKSERAEERASLLLELAEIIQKKIQDRK
jgi:hypothetical protein